MNPRQFTSFLTILFCFYVSFFLICIPNVFWNLVFSEVEEQREERDYEVDTCEGEDPVHRH